MRSNNIIFIAILLFSTIALSQGLSTKGYILKKDGSQLNGYIERFHISENPDYIGFSTEKRATAFDRIPISEISKVSPKGKRIYLISEVEIDNTANAIDQLQEGNRYPGFDQTLQTIFLEILVEGDATLYRSFLDSREKFFYKLGGSDTISQLLYKKYFLPRSAFYVGNDFARENKEYLRQLSQFVPCFNKRRRMLTPEFTKPALKNHFEKFNESKCYN